jgi:hypothetical protein
MRLRYLAPVVIVVVVGSVITLAIAGGSESETGFDQANSDLTPASLQEFTRYPVYTLGSEFDGEPLTAINHRVGSPESRAPVRADYVSLKYGSCEPTSDSGCAAPLEMQTWPACRRNRAMYLLAPDIDGSGPAKAIPYPREDVTVRGVPAAVFDNGSRLELYTGDVTIVLFGSQRNQLFAAAAAIQGANEAVAGVDPGESLSLPVAGALTGHVACQ